MGLFAHFMLEANWCNPRFGAPEGFWMDLMRFEKRRTRRRAQVPCRRGLVDMPNCELSHSDATGAGIDGFYRRCQCPGQNIQQSVTELSGDDFCPVGWSKIWRRATMRRTMLEEPSSRALPQGVDAAKS
jgi:hypothetical protein